jgi:hypothetical protein
MSPTLICRRRATVTPSARDAWASHDKAGSMPSNVSWIEAPAGGFSLDGSEPMT